jgi:hypothetical protein
VSQPYQIPAGSVTAVTTDLAAAYRAVRRAADSLPALRRAGVVAQLADSSAAAHRAVIARHDDGEAERVLRELHGAFAGDDWLRRLNRWRRGLFAVVGVQAATVVALVLWIVSVVSGIGQTLVVLGADRGVFVILLALGCFGVQLSDRYHGWDRKLDRPTMVRLRDAERRFYAAISGRPPLVRRDHGLRLAVALVPSVAWLVVYLIAGLLLISWTS